MIRSGDIANAINTLGAFCGMRDVSRLDQSVFSEKYGFAQADVFVLFGGSIAAGGDVLGQVIKSRLSKTCVIVGGAGHTTDTLWQAIGREHPDIETAGLPEAEIFQLYIEKVYGCRADYLETRSTNCGNNITNLLELLEEKQVQHSSIVLCQDATMQRRMDAVLRKYAPDNLTINNFASYQAIVECTDEALVDNDVSGHKDALRYKDAIHGMWDMDRYVNLLMGEIPRLRDDENGYGPRGTGFIAHVDIPEEVLTAFELLKQVYGEETRAANPLFASDRNR